MYNGTKNTVQFNKTGDCRVCGYKGTQLKCSAMKLWEFDDETGKLTVYHEGNHTCTARRGRNEISEKLNEKFKGSQGSAGKVAEDAIMEELKKV